MIDRSTVSICTSIDCYDVAFDKLNTPEYIESIATGLVGVLGSELIKSVTYRFVPQGVTCVLIIAESSIVIHTWPEHEYMQIDINCCKQYDERIVVSYLKTMYDLHGRIICFDREVGEKWSDMVDYSWRDF